MRMLMSRRFCWEDAILFGSDFPAGRTKGLLAVTMALVVGGGAVVGFGIATCWSARVRASLSHGIVS